MSAQIFLSYSHNDTLLMQQVRDSLHTRGLKVWTDEDLEPGTPNWMIAIQHAIEESVAMIVIMTPDAASSIWVAREIGLAHDEGKPIFPLLAKGTKSEATPVKLILGAVQFIDIRTTAFSTGIDSLVKVLVLQDLAW